MFYLINCWSIVRRAESKLLIDSNSAVVLNCIPFSEPALGKKLIVT
jgi:hypothetical protein